MVLNNEKINEIIAKCAESSHVVRVRDVSFVILSHFYEDKEVAYRCVFGDDGYFESYIKDKSIVYLEKYIQDFLFYADSKKDITFEENKAYMLKLKKETEDAMANGEIDKKDGLKILADLSVKLNDRFQVKEDVKDQIVQVCTKYNDICPNCGIEISRAPISKVEAMEMYGLIDKK